MYTRVKNAKEVELMRTSGRMLATILELLESKAIAGVTTKYLADVAAKELKSLGGEPTFLGYGGDMPFPDVICISVNDEVVHGIPRDDLVLKSGDVVSIDFGVTYDGMVTDAARTFYVDDCALDIKRLIIDTEKSMNAGIDVVKSGIRIGDISRSIQKVLDQGGYGIVRDLVGHGVGHELHEEPDIPNYGFAGSGPVLNAGMTIAIEPMATLGTHSVVLDNDGWTIRTADGSAAAHFENTILVTERGYEILTTL